MHLKLAACLVALFTLGGAVWGEDIAAVVAKITGKAQLLKGEVWVPLALGQKLANGDTISTGFRSELQLKIGPSIVTVKPLSRLTVQALVQEGTSLKTDLYLKVGKVDAEVNKSEIVQTQKFQVSSPVATASVRGTAFSFDGLNLQVTRGLVDFSDRWGNTFSIPVGESARVALKSSKQGVTTNQKLVVQESLIASSDPSQAAEEEASVSLNGWSLNDLLALLYGYNWFGDGGWTEVYLSGIDPLPLPALTFFSIGGIDALPLPATTVVTVGGIDLFTPAAQVYVDIGGIDP